MHFGIDFLFYKFKKNNEYNISASDLFNIFL